VNRVLPELFGTREEQAFEAISEAPVTDELSAALGGPAEPLLEAARLMVKMRRSRAAHVERLRDAIGRRLSPASSSATVLGLYYVPFMFLRSYGLRSTRQVASALAAELGS
jgi:hypothetical protein